MLIFIFQFLQLLARLFLVRQFLSLGSRSFAKVILPLADHEELGIRIVQKFGLQGHPSEVSELLEYSDKIRSALCPIHS